MKRSAVAYVIVVATGLAACGGSSPAAQRPGASGAASTDAAAREDVNEDASDEAPEAPPGVECPEQALTSARAAGGTCFDPSIVGEDVVAACVAQLAAEGWVHDPIAEQKLGEQTHMTLVCWHLLATASR